MGLLPNEDSSTTMYYYHPTFLYESLWNITGFVLINLVYKKKRFNGQVACMYLSWYGFGRMFIEGLRTDSLYVGPFRISQVVGALCFIVFGGLLIAGLIYSKKIEEKQSLTAFDKLLVPSLVENPVFFEKKAEANEINIETEESNKEDSEDEENGTDH
jgi:prolipoprotein diacylglyceryltransferase